MRAFIVRPFGTKDGIDFDRVERELIVPVLEEFQIEGRTTQEIARAGNIRTDMFERLLLADLVIADISVHNANVYYELGIRHAFRERTTILIRAEADDIPFDLRTDRYLEYARDDPGAATSQLEEAVRQSFLEQRADSPVYLLLPRLEPHDPATFGVVPQGFTEAVESATQANDAPMLALLGEEIQGLDWALSGRRLIGNAQIQLRAWSPARATWESIRAERPDDIEANLRLGTIYQRLEEYAASSAALGRVLMREDLTGSARAEALALMGSNAKVQWIDEWRGTPVEKRQAVALGSTFLQEALRAYEDGFSEDQNHYYSGINALALAAVMSLLAKEHPETWTSCFATDEKAEAEGRRLERRRLTLDAAVRRSLEAGEYRQRRTGSPQRAAWLDMTWADYHLLTSTRPPYVRAAYSRARAGLTEEGFSTDSAARQLRMYLRLGLMVENVRAALQGLEAPEEEPAAMGARRARILVFSGHRIDAPDRESPRFPAERAEQARGMIRAAVAEEQALAGDALMEGIAGGASGGDILFHEVCDESGIPTVLLLALPPDAFAARSVADAGPEWMERFRRLRARVPPRVLSDSEELPEWLVRRPGYSIWQRNNLWTLHTALSREDAEVTLIVLWDGRGGDGPGGTKDMVEIAKRRGVKVVHLDARTLIPSS